VTSVTGSLPGEHGPPRVTRFLSARVWNLLFILRLFAMKLINVTGAKWRPTAYEFSGNTRANARVLSAATRG